MLNAATSQPCHTGYPIRSSTGPIRYPVICGFPLPAFARTSFAGMTPLRHFIACLINVVLMKDDCQREQIRAVQRFSRRTAGTTGGMEPYGYCALISIRSLSSGSGGVMVIRSSDSTIRISPRCCECLHDPVDAFGILLRKKVRESLRKGRGQKQECPPLNMAIYPGRGCA